MKRDFYLNQEKDYILVAEDSRVQAKRLRFFFDKHKLNHKLLDNGADALEQAKQEKPAMIISDIVMPVMDGYEFCKKIKEVPDLQDIPVILLTSLNNPLDIVKGLQAGADNFITKPYDEQYLLDRIKYLLANRYLRDHGAPDTGIEIVFQGQRFHINSSRKQILDLLLSVYEAAVSRNTQLLEAQRQLQLLNEDLKSANNELDAFAHTVSHDLRSPLGGILGFAEILKDDYGDKLDEEGKGYLDSIMQSANNMAKLIEKLLEFSRSKKSNIDPSHVDVSQIAAEVVQSLKKTTCMKKYDITIENDLHAYADKGLVKILLFNLLGNAVKYSQTVDSPKITLGSKKQDEQDVFYVEDNGVGFDMRKAKSLLQPFTRLHHDEQYSGSGVGLSTVHRIVARHGGKLWFESEPGKGATFFFTLGDFVKPDTPK